MSMTLLVLIGAPTAVAQSGMGTSADTTVTASTTGTTINGGIPQAPVGHRQPREVLHKLVAHESGR